MQKPTPGAETKKVAAPIRVLQVDDDSVMRDIVALSLGLDPRFVTLSCENAKSAISIAIDQVPDLILCDVCMPDIDGPAMLARLREVPCTARIPFIFVTANARAKETEALKAYGSVAVITKPFVPKMLAQEVQDHLCAIRKHEDIPRM
jgi:CheY-like chemotaxis protein